MIGPTSSPTTKGINAIQLWILGCVIFSFLSLIDFLVMLIHMRRKNKKHDNGRALFDNFDDTTNNEQTKQKKQTSKQHLTKRDLSNQDMIYEVTPMSNTLPSNVAVHTVNCCQHQNGNRLDLHYVRGDGEQPRELTRIYLYHHNLTLFGYPTFFLIYVGFYLWVYRKTIYGYVD